MTPIAKQTLAACPAEWTDLDVAEKGFPTEALAPGSLVLMQLIKSGLIEERLHGTPSRVQVRKAQKEAG